MSNDDELDLYHITAPHFCAGLLADSHVRRAAPILSYMAKQRWNIGRVIEYCHRKGWTIEKGKS